MSKLGGKIGTLLLAIWLLLWGLMPLLNLSIPSGELILAILAIVAAIFIFLEIRDKPTKNLGRMALAIWLLLMGLLPLLNITFPAREMVLAVVAVAAGVLLLLGR